MKFEDSISYSGKKRTPIRDKDDLWSNHNRYTESLLEFISNGRVRRLQRHGLKANEEYGKVNNLHISYDGNRITTVLEDSEMVTRNGSMDYPGKNREMAFEYNFGARQYYSAVPHFTRIDPLCEKYYWLSPYLFSTYHM